eukprot:CAMPEP_0176348114 /NCGR_PEP_ID=MMETSP0126-20121128/7613_1 /TAXON_ID=141414 ORGANISM="Strombidinopsis acuminatum, Strain SPMC142" /NCGR_SAMPLE_ID=MMETSP0126 /ASSEMBLY_ACC=CAM_ASM_000229 /LENGTH=45 /DNA_ID= /DNA_START= /DNA_END= /DNA_ORIENTATION=
MTIHSASIKNGPDYLAMPLTKCASCNGDPYPNKNCKGCANQLADD